MGNVHMEATQINYREGDKKMSVAEAIKNAGNTGLAHTADIAPEFSTESAYNAGDFVYYNGSLYEFTANHAAGAWSTADTQAATISNELASLESGLTNVDGKLSIQGYASKLNVWANESDGKVVISVTIPGLNADIGVIINPDGSIIKYDSRV